MTPSPLIILLFSLVVVQAFAQWNADPAINTPVCLSVNDQKDMKLVSDSKGGAIITWIDYRTDTTEKSGDIYVQRVDKNGYSKWTLNGVAICSLSSDQASPSIEDDGNGGAIITWTDKRNGNRDIYAQKIDSSGNILWAADGVPVIVKANEQQNARLLEDGSGGAFVVWEDLTGNNTYDIYAQHINSAGVITWAAGGVLVCNALDSQINQRLKKDTAGGAIIVWQDKRNGLNYDIYAQRINASGVVLWAANGVAVSKVVDTQSNPKIESDGAGGAYIAWQDKRNDKNYDIYVQRVDASGTMQWTANGLVVCSANDNQSALDITSNGLNGLILTWKDNRKGNNDIYAQKINDTGTAAWTANGIAITTNTAPQINPNIVGNKKGGAIITWQDSTPGHWDIKAQYLDENGAAKWTSEGENVSIAADNQTSAKNISDGQGGSIFVWEDNRNDKDDNIYVHHLSEGGAINVDEHHVIISSTVAPNPFAHSSNILIANFKLVSPQVFITDAIGRQVFPAIVQQGNSFVIYRNNLPTGVYIYSVSSSGSVITSGKFIIKD